MHRLYRMYSHPTPGRRRMGLYRLRRPTIPGCHRMAMSRMYRQRMDMYRMYPQRMAMYRMYPHQGRRKLAVTWYRGLCRCRAAPMEGKQRCVGALKTVCG
jgi:hypothetical protein